MRDGDLFILASLHKMIPKDNADYENFQNRAIRWSASCDDEPKTGNKALRKEFGVNLWQARLYHAARNQLLYCDDGKCFGEMLVQFSIEHGKLEETDLFLAQAVLQLLCINSIQVAKDVFATYTEKHPNSSSLPPFKQPLINFLLFLFNSIDRQERTWFITLTKQYQPSLKRDPTYQRYIAIIGETYFNLKSKSSAPSSAGGINSIFSNMMNMFNTPAPEDDGDASTEEVKEDKPAAAEVEDDLD